MIDWKGVTRTSQMQYDPNAATVGEKVVLVPRAELQGCIGKSWDTITEMGDKGERGLALRIAGFGEYAPPDFAYLREGGKHGLHKGGWTLMAQGWTKES